MISPQTGTYHHKAFIDTVLNNDRDDGETILKPQGWFNGLPIRDQSDDAKNANQLITTMMITKHYQMSQFTGSKKVSYPVARSEIRTYNHTNDS